jgi:hypothetical protein
MLLRDSILIAAFVVMTAFSLPMVAFSADAGNGTASLAAQSVNTTTDENGMFYFRNISAGSYTVEAYKCILGSMHYMGDASVTVPGNCTNVTIKLSRANDTRYASFTNATAGLTSGKHNISGTILGGNRPGAEPEVIPYSDALVKITSFKAAA